MKLLKNVLQTFWKDESGQSTTEYILILFVAVAFAMKFKGAVGSLIDTMISGLTSNLNQAMEVN